MREQLENEIDALETELDRKRSALVELDLIDHDASE